MPSAGTSGNRVRKYSSVIPSLPHAKTLQLFNVIAQLMSSGGRFSVNWGVLGVRGKGTSALEQRDDAPYRSDGRTGHCVRFINHFGGCSDRLVAVQKVGAARKMRPRGRTLLLLCLLNARLATTRLIDQRGLTALAILTTPSLDRRLAGNLVLDHGSRTVRPFSRRSFTTASLTSYE